VSVLVLNVVTDTLTHKALRHICASWEKTLKQAIEVLKDYAEKEIKGKEQLDQAKAKNKDIKLLRNKYLHWNSTYGSSFGEQIIEKNKPRIVKEKRKRDTI
jgi:hypothetical protein